MQTERNCIFCKIIRGEVPASKVLETASMAAFLDIQPLAPGHLLVVPTEHYETLAEVPPSLLAEVTTELPRLARALLEAVQASALNLTCNSGKDSGQEIPHLHFHLIPRWPKDGLPRTFPRVAQPPAEREALCARIVAALHAPR